VAKSGRAWVVPRYSGDEIAIGIAVTIALHAIPLLLIVLKVIRPLSSTLDETAVVARPVIAANVMKLGAPLDPNKLPDRLVPKKSGGPTNELHASREDPLHADAGPNQNQNQQPNQTNQNDPFAEDAGRTRPEIGSDAGMEGGLETDPTKVHAGDMYALKLSGFFHDRWTIPTVITPADERKLCVVYRINISPRMVIWHINTVPTKKSANDLFDDSARTMLQKLLDDRTVLPEPPNEVADQYKGRTVDLTLAGKGGDGKSCQ
jgi:hypothetical protein